LQFFLYKGLDINSIDGDGFTVLHKAVLYNKPKELAFLLSKKADRDAEIDMSDHSERVGVKSIDSLNALKYAIYLQRERNQDRSAIIAMLTQ
jgi:ankyrin repeat protein